MFGNAWKVGRIAGVEIRIDASWAVVALLITYSLYVQFTIAYDDLSTGSAIALAVGAAVLFFVSVLTHEMAHAVMAKARKIKVQDITLFMFGGATRAKVESRGPGAEFLIAVVGPLTSLALAGLFWAIAAIGQPNDPVPGVIGYLAWVNFMLAVFNLVPGFPLDGGRLLRSAVWKATGSLRTATRVASIGGQVVGYLLIVGGVVSLLSESLAGGIWLAAIGWFLVQAARQSYEDLQLRLILERIDADDVMARDLVNIPPDLTVQQAVDDFFMRHDHGAFPVRAPEGRTTGVITLRGVKRIPRDEWAQRQVGDVMTPLSEEVVVGPDTRMDTVMAKLQESEGHRVLVAENGEVTGIITTSDVARWLHRRRAIESRAGA